jgi:GT2 family glycosyltransferase
MPAWAASWNHRHSGEEVELPMLGLFCAALRREVWDRIGPLDERFGIGLFEDDDYSLRLRRAGYRLVCRRDAFVHHWQRASFRADGEKAYRQLYRKNHRLFVEKWAERGLHPSETADR